MLHRDNCFCESLNLLFSNSGQWDRGHRHGIGELVDHNSGTTFTGEWKYDRKHGQGEEIYPDGSR